MKCSSLYKIKKKGGTEFWSGYSSSFSRVGASFTSMALAARALKDQLSLRHHSIADWVDDAEIVEYEVTTTEAGSSSAKDAIIKYTFMATIENQYDRGFIKAYNRICSNPTTRNKYNFAIKVTRYEEFREALKTLGYSSRNYKKMDYWLWFESEDIAVAVKLLGLHVEFVSLADLENAYQAALVEGRASSLASTMRK